MSSLVNYITCDNEITMQTGDEWKNYRLHSFKQPSHSVKKKKISKRIKDWILNRPFYPVNPMIWYDMFHLWKTDIQINVKRQKQDVQHKNKQ